MSVSHYRIPPSALPHHRAPHSKDRQLWPTHVPSITEDISFRRHASAVSIPRLREAIHSLDCKMASLMSQRHDLEYRLEQAVRLQSPVHRLPSELLATIFITGVLEMGDDNPIMVPTLMLVCRYWAEIALDTPILWSKIAISPHDSLEKARRKLTRSKSSPLDITINFGPRVEYTNSVTEQVIHAMDMVRPALWRTRSFSLSVPNRPQAHAALSRCQEEVPLLESLTIQIYHSMQDDRYSSPILPLFKGQTPRLRSVSLTSFNFGWDLRLVSSLRVLKLGGYFNGFAPSSSTLIGILRQCPELEELALRNMSDVDSYPCYGVVPEDFETPTGKPIRLSKLTKVSFYCSGFAFTRQIMSQLTFPNLESLELCYLENITPILQLLYNQALTRLPMQHLRIESCLFNEPKFVNLLRRLTSLTKLELADVEDASTSLLKSLSSSQPWICPKLHTVTLDGCTSFDWDSLRSFVESRLPANSYPHFSDAQAFRSAQLASVSASSSASNASRQRQHRSLQHKSRSIAILGSNRLRSIDVTRCTQISKEMVQWLRMYVSDVRCEPAKGIWGGP
ncbi:hypothetical protein K435DRAFT_818198 [Dendrothele bispora CBS 962.96]|uniref:F-box domain-containing protein n=1 Tax=Dendrothele bispora (strain CBS 962.96) TaxID=1314807 RepID=A0A4S8ME21_DENBC|nr:hypothetical protein K435DRAFT_818198 [Dendrothele bispora CBS 962.96]